MWRKVRHVSDGELLLLADEGALSARRRSRALAHVAECPRCARRRSELAAAASEVGRACRERSVEMVPLHVARARLGAALEVPAARTRERVWALRGLAAAAVLLMAVVTWSGGDGVRPGPTGATSPAATIDRLGPTSRLLLPRPDLTPGSVRPVGVEDICHGAPAGGPVVRSQVPRQVFEAYGVDYRRAGDYELDFLITPELGGASDASNLWPQPYRSVVWNAYVKDELERHLRQLVCRGALDLATAQRELAGDWIAAYKRRFDTERPLRDYGRFPLTASDVEALQAEALERRLLAVSRRS